MLSYCKHILQRAFVDFPFDTVMKKWPLKKSTHVKARVQKHTLFAAKMVKLSYNRHPIYD